MKKSPRRKAKPSPPKKMNSEMEDEFDEEVQNEIVTSQVKN
jgi:hypothetical protein